MSAGGDLIGWKEITGYKSNISNLLNSACRYYFVVFGVPVPAGGGEHSSP